MTPTAADHLAKRIINTWRGGPPITEWRDQLEHLDEGRAGTAFVRLRGQLDNAPTIARFMAEYKAIDTGADREKCDYCSETGWVAVELENGDPAWFEFHGQQYTGAQPCHCRHGQIAAQSKTWTEAKPRLLGAKRVAA